MFGTGLARKEDQFLGAAAVRVDIHDELQARLFEFAEAEVGHLDVGLLPSC